MKALVALSLLAASSLASAQGACDTATTFPDGTHPVCSVTFVLTQTPATTGEMVFNWTIANGPGDPTQYPKRDWRMRPWAPFDINIVKVELVEWINDGHGFFMVGNNSQGDPMCWLGPAEWHTQCAYPDGTSWRFPGTANATPNDYIDLHGYGFAGKYSDVRVTFFYTVSP